MGVREPNAEEEGKGGNAKSEPETAAYRAPHPTAEKKEGRGKTRLLDHPCVRAGEEVSLKTGKGIRKNQNPLNGAQRTPFRLVSQNLNARPGASKEKRRPGVPSIPSLFARGVQSLQEGPGAPVGEERIKKKLMSRNAKVELLHRRKKKKE